MHVQVETTARFDAKKLVSELWFANVYTSRGYSNGAVGGVGSGSPCTVVNIYFRAPPTVFSFVIDAAIVWGLVALARAL